MVDMFKRNKVRRSREFEGRMDRNALVATIGGAAIGVGIGYAFNGAAGGGLGFYIGGLGLGTFNRCVIEPLNARYHDWCIKMDQESDIVATNLDIGADPEP